MSKTGQITVFIILGLILLVSIGLTIYFTTEQVIKPVEEEIIVPQDVRPVYEFVADCTGITGEDAIRILGLQGGYIKLPGIIDKTPTSYIRADNMGVVKIPYWYYEGEDRTPDLGQIERDIARHVRENLKTCTADFAALERYKVAEEGNLSAQVTAGESDVIVRLSWPLAVTTGEQVTRLKDFVVKIPVRLKKIHELASAIMQTENQQTLFEKATIDLMSADQKHIPLDGFTIECETKRWRIPEITERLQKLLYHNIPTTRVKNTKYVPFIAPTRTYESLRKEAQRMTKQLEQGKELTPPRQEAPDDAYQYFKLFMDTGTQPTDLRVGFEYQPEWGLQLAAQPSEGPVLKSNTGKGPGRFLRFLCINQWHFVYDIIYPVKVTIRDDAAFKGTGYLFQFAFPVLINNNAPERIVFGYRKFQSQDFGAPEFCTTLSREESDIRALGTMEGIPIMLELPDAHITYRCLDQECDLGKTVAEGGIYRLVTHLPRGCTNPFITASKDGYLPVTKQMTGRRLDLVLPKIQDYKLKFLVHPYHAPTQTWGQPRELKPNERVSLSLSLVNDTFDQITGFPTLNETLQLILETRHYDIDAMLFLNERQIGGFIGNAQKITYEEIAGKTTATLHVVEYLPSPVTDKQKIEMTTFLHEGEYQDELKPTFE